MNRIPAIAAALPAILLAVGSLWSIAAVPVGGGLWPPDDVTLTEAIVTRNAAETSRLIGSGTDPNRPAHVRPGLITSDREYVLTPLVAAVWVRDSLLVSVLLRSGALPGPDELRVLRCLNEARLEENVRRVLERASRAPWPDCSEVTLPAVPR